MVMQLLQELPALLALFSCGIVGWFILGWASGQYALRVSSGNEKHGKVVEDDADASSADDSLDQQSEDHPPAVAAFVVERTMPPKNKLSATRRRAKRQQASNAASAVVSSETIEFNSDEKPMLEQDAYAETACVVDEVTVVESFEVGLLTPEVVSAVVDDNAAAIDLGVLEEAEAATLVFEEPMVSVDSSTRSGSGFSNEASTSTPLADWTEDAHDVHEAVANVGVARTSDEDDEVEWENSGVSLPWGLQTEQSNSFVAATDGWMGSFEAMPSGPSFDNMQVGPMFGGMQADSLCCGVQDAAPIFMNQAFTDGSQVYEPMLTTENGQQFYTDGQMVYAVTCVKVDEPCNDICYLPAPTMYDSFSYVSPCDLSEKHYDMEEAAEWNACWDFKSEPSTNWW